MFSVTVFIFFIKKSLLLFSKNQLNWLKVTAKDICNTLTFYLSKNPKKKCITIPPIYSIYYCFNFGTYSFELFMLMPWEALDMYDVQYLAVMQNS